MALEHLQHIFKYFNNYGLEYLQTGKTTVSNIFIVIAFYSLRRM